MYLIISWFYSLGKISWIVPEPKRKNLKTEKLNFPERSRKRFSIWIQFFSFSVFLFFSFSVLLTELFRNICGETDKLKNWIFQRDPGRDSPYGFSFIFFCFSVFLFFSFAYGTLPEHFRRQNWKTEKLFFNGESLPGSLWKKQFFSFSVFQFCLRNSSGTFPETKLKNWKTVFLWRISPWMSLEKTVFQFFSFAYGTLPEHFRRQNWKTETVCLWRISPWISLEKPVFQFFSFSVLLTELFRNISGDKTEKLKNCFFMENLSLDVSGKNSFSVFQFFSFSVLLTEVFRNIPHFLVVQCMSYIFIWARYVTPQTKLTKSRGQNVPETL